MLEFWISESQGNPTRKTFIYLFFIYQIGGIFYKHNLKTNSIKNIDSCRQKMNNILGNIDCHKNFFKFIPMLAQIAVITIFKMKLIT